MTERRRSNAAMEAHPGGKILISMCSCGAVPAEFGALGSGGELGCCAIIVAGAAKAGYDTALAEMYRLSDRCASL